MNQTIKKYGLVPASIELKVKPANSRAANIVASSQHTISMELDALDLQRIKLAKTCWTKFREVELAEFRDLSGFDRLSRASVKRDDSSLKR